MKYEVRIERMVGVTVEVEAESPQAAAEQVDQRSFPLPEANQWEPVKGHTYIVIDPETGDEILETQ